MSCTILALTETWDLASTTSTPHGCPPPRNFATYSPWLLRALPLEHLWVNPNCGLKTRTYEEIEPSLVRVVEAAWNVRDQERTH